MKDQQTLYLCPAPYRGGGEVSVLWGVGTDIMDIEREMLSWVWGALDWENGTRSTLLEKHISRSVLPKDKR